MTIAALAHAVIAADDAWNDAYAARDNEALYAAEMALQAARDEFNGALCAETGISVEMFSRLGFTL